MQRIASSLGIAAIATIAEDRVLAHLPHGPAATAAVKSAAALGFDQALLVTAGMSMLGLGATTLLVALSVFGVLGLALTVVIAFNIV